MAITRTQVFNLLKRIEEKLAHPSHVVLGSRTNINMDSIKVLLQSILTKNTEIDTAVDLLGKETTLASVLTALGPLALEATQLLIDTKLGSLDTKATTRDGLLGTIDTDTGNIAGSTADTKSGIDDLNTKFGLLGTVGALILTIQLTIVVITAQLTEGGFNVAELLTTIKANIGTIDVDTGNISNNTASTSSSTAAIIDFQDRQFGNQIWEYSETFTVAGGGGGTFIANFLCPANNNWSQIRVGSGASVLAAVENYEVLIMDRSSALVAIPVGLIDFLIGVNNVVADISPSLVMGPLNNIQISEQVGARAWLAAESFTITIRAAQHFSTTLAAVPTITGTGTFTRVLNFNRVTTV